MKFKPAFEIGQTVTNKELVSQFGCSPQGGIRRAHKTNTLVIISIHAASRAKVYDDKKIDNVFHYTGMGMSGDQILTFAQNKTIYESRTNGVALHFFEVFKAKEYTYMGEVELHGEPYQEMQVGEDGVDRKVWMFPLLLKSDENPRTYIDKQLIEGIYDDEAKLAVSLGIDELRGRAIRNGSEASGSRITNSTTYTRNSYVAEYTKRMAKGVCQLCEVAAPFSYLNGDPYLESHHIDWLSNGGPDTIFNTVALCPNCHKKMHVRHDKNDIEKLFKIAAGGHTV